MEEPQASHPGPLTALIDEVVEVDCVVDMDVEIVVEDVVDCDVVTVVC